MRNATRGYCSNLEKGERSARVRSFRPRVRPGRDRGTSGQSGERYRRKAGLSHPKPAVVCARLLMWVGVPEVEGVKRGEVLQGGSEARRAGGIDGTGTAEVEGKRGHIAVGI